MPTRRFSAAGTAVLVVVLLLMTAASKAAGHSRSDSAGPALISVYSVAHPRGLIATTGGWAYCEQLRVLARRTHYTLLCGRYAKDGYLGYGLRRRRHLDWGDPSYLTSLAGKIEVEHER